MKLGACLLALAASLACSSAAPAETFPKSGPGVPYRDYLQKTPCPIVEGACVVAFDPAPEGKVLIVTDIYCVAPGVGDAGVFVIGGNGSRPSTVGKTVGFLPFPTSTSGLGTLVGANLPFAAGERPKITFNYPHDATPNVGCSITGNLFQAS